jgi:hypothetical protein
MTATPLNDDEYETLDDLLAAMGGNRWTSRGWKAT